MEVVCVYLIAKNHKLMLFLGIYTFGNGERYDGKYKEGMRSGKVFWIFWPCIKSTLMLYFKGEI